MKFLLDTSAVSAYLGSVEPVVQRIQRVRPSNVAVSAITVMELRYGATLRQSPKLIASVEAFLSDISILTFDAGTAERVGVLRASIESKGLSIALAGFQIAGTALVPSLIHILRSRRKRKCDECV